MEIENTEELLSMSQEEFDKKIQSAADKVRTEYSKKIKELESKVEELTPTQKSEAEIDYENRLATLEAKEKRMALIDSLTEKGVDRKFADYFKSDVNVDDFLTFYNDEVESQIAKRIRENGYVPDSHKSGDVITQDTFKKMSMDELERLFTENPALYRSLAGR